jgi:HPt (histidine-containing phosphotransfer) domain-containing protein
MQADHTGDDRVLDREIVEQLLALTQAGNPSLLGRLQASFARDTPERLAALRAAVAAGDSDGVAFNAHTIKGSAANLGAVQVVETCEQIESLPALTEAGTVERLLDQLEQRAATAEGALARLADAA